MDFKDMHGKKAHQFGAMVVNPAINATVNTEGNKSIDSVFISEAEQTDLPGRLNMGVGCEGEKRQKKPSWLSKKDDVVG